MSITYVIPGTSLLDQLNEPTSDGLPDENKDDNCVAASFAEGLHILLGGNWDGDEVKDAVYGQGYVGVQSAARYVQYASDHGVHLAPHDDTQAGLISTIHAQIHQNHPVIVTMPSNWGTAPANPVSPGISTHVGIAVGDGAGYIRVMNPWHGFYQDQPDAWWQARLCYGQVWPMQKVSTSVSGIPSGWTDANGVLTAPAAPDGKRYTCVRGMRLAVTTENHDPTDVPVCEEFSVGEVEVGNTSIGPGVIQFFLKSGQKSWAANFNGGNVFSTWNGREMLALRNALAADVPASQVQSLQAQLNSANSQVAQLQAQIAKLQQQPPAQPLTSQQQGDLAAMAALRSALG